MRAAQAFFGASVRCADPAGVVASGDAIPACGGTSMRLAPLSSGVSVTPCAHASTPNLPCLFEPLAKFGERNSQRGGPISARMVYLAEIIGIYMFAPIVDT